MTLVKIYSKYFKTVSLDRAHLDRAIRIYIKTYNIKKNQLRAEKLKKTSNSKNLTICIIFV